MSVFRPEYRRREAARTDEDSARVKPDRTDMLALIIAAFQVLGPYALFLIASVVLVAVVLLKVWAR